MKSESPIKEVENKIHHTETIAPSPNTTVPDVMETNEITLEEVAIDGICGVY